jgi:hypothetical protein
VIWGQAGKIVGMSVLLALVVSIVLVAVHRIFPSRDAQRYGRVSAWNLVLTICQLFGLFAGALIFRLVPGPPLGWPRLLFAAIYFPGLLLLTFALHRYLVRRGVRMTFEQAAASPPNKSLERTRDR